MNSISSLIKEYGRQEAKSYLLSFFEDEKNLKYFASIFSTHIESPLPDYQRELHSIIPNHSRIALAAPRGSGKTTTIDLVILAYYALFNKSPFSLLISDTMPQSRLHLEALANELEVNEIIHFLFGDVKGETWGADSILIKTKYGESLILAKGAGQKIRGLKFRNHRPHLALIDDLENDEMVESEDRRIKLENWFRFNFLRGLDKDWSKVIMLGTILHENALLKKIIDKKEPYQGWEVRKYKAIKDDGTSFWESRFPLTYLKDIRDNPMHPEYAGSIVFAQEFQNEPRSDKDRIIKALWLKYYYSSSKVEDEAWLEKLNIIGGVDPAISESETSSFFSFTTIGIDKEGHAWHLETIRGKFSGLVQAQKIVECYKRWRHDKIGIESIAYQKVLSQLVKTEGAKEKVYPSIKEIFTDKDKVRRMVGLSARFEGGFVHLDNDSPELENLKKEILSFPAKPNDSVDSLMLALESDAKPKPRVFKRKARVFSSPGLRQRIM